MRPHVVGSACGRVQAAVDEALATGTLSLPPELAAHAARCPRCSRDVQETESMFTRLRDAAAGVGLGRVPQVVDFVTARALQDGVGPTRLAPTSSTTADGKRVQARWVLGQVAAVAAVLLVTVSGFTYVALKMNEAVSGVKPGEVLQHLASPFSQSNWDWAKLGRAK